MCQFFAERCRRLMLDKVELFKKVAGPRTPPTVSRDVYQTGQVEASSG